MPLPSPIPCVCTWSPDSSHEAMFPPRKGPAPPAWLLHGRCDATAAPLRDLHKWRCTAGGAGRHEKPVASGRG